MCIPKFFYLTLLHVFLLPILQIKLNNTRFKFINAILTSYSRDGSGFVTKGILVNNKTSQKRWRKQSKDRIEASVGQSGNWDVGSSTSTSLEVLEEFNIILSWLVGSRGSGLWKSYSGVLEKQVIGAIEGWEYLQVDVLGTRRGSVAKVLLKSVKESTDTVESRIIPEVTKFCVRS